MRQSHMLLIALISLLALGIDAGIAHATPTVRVPEPGTLTLLAAGVVALGGVGLLRKRKK